MLKVNTGDWLSFTVATARERSLSPCSQKIEEKFGCLENK